MPEGKGSSSEYFSSTRRGRKDATGENAARETDLRRGRMGFANRQRQYNWNATSKKWMVRHLKEARYLRKGENSNKENSKETK